LVLSTFSLFLMLSSNSRITWKNAARHLGKCSSAPRKMQLGNSKMLIADKRSLSRSELEVNLVLFCRSLVQFVQYADNKNFLQILSSSKFCRRFIRINYCYDHLIPVLCDRIADKIFSKRGRKIHRGETFLLVLFTNISWARNKAFWITQKKKDSAETQLKFG
jgi:hypothetical protein